MKKEGWKNEKLFFVLSNLNVACTQTALSNMRFIKQFCFRFLVAVCVFIVAQVVVILTVVNLLLGIEREHDSE